MVGDTLGSYRIKALLGQGGMGRVYLGEHALIGRRVAIKVLLPSLSAQSDVVERFFNEARAAAQLRHPGLVDVFDFGHHTDGSAYLVMEYLEGISLAGRLEQSGPLLPELAVEIARQVAVALSAAHRRAIVHRDLKPDNVFLVADAELPCRLRAKILDFGIAKLSGDLAGGVKTRTDSIMGTPTYMSPEQCRGAGNVDHRADIYSLGCVLFEMLCGRPPFTGQALWGLIAGHMSTEPPLPSSITAAVPAELDKVVRRMLEKTVEARYQDTRDVVTDLEAVARTLPAPDGEVAAAPSPIKVGWKAEGPSGLDSVRTTLGGSVVERSIEPPAPPPKRGRGLLVGVGVAAGIAALTATVLLRPGHRAESVAPPAHSLAAPANLPTAAVSPTVAPLPAAVTLTAPPSPALTATPDLGAPLAAPVAIPGVTHAAAPHTKRPPVKSAAAPHPAHKAEHGAPNRDAVADPFQ